MWAVSSKSGFSENFNNERRTSFFGGLEGTSSCLS